jgi:hypothetical protein
VGRGSGRKINQGAAPDRERLRTGSGSGPAVPDRCVAAAGECVQTLSLSWAPLSYF